MPYLRFVLRSSKSSFKKLIVSMQLRHQLKTMSEAKAVPKGLKDQEVERGSVKKRPPVPYVPVMDEVQARKVLIQLSCPTRPSLLLTSGIPVHQKPFLFTCKLP